MIVETIVFVCDDCGKEFGAPATLRIHQNTSCDGKKEPKKEKKEEPKEDKDDKKAARIPKKKK